MTNRKIIAFDLDDVLCKRNVEGNNIEKYLHCLPNISMIEVCNKSYEDGNYVVVYTARGMKVFNKDVKKIYENLYELTKNQLKTWGVKYHELVMGKIHYDLLIDDKALNSESINSIEDIKSFLKIEQ